ncbi:hypothetical protein I5Q41_14450 [Pseudomonas monteilii]|jgi:hypothetical protein|nr:hypothetical protein [Pseudomonas monteilii]MBA6091769.1 hypothetical protein [Pseudomonas monteilii]MBH3395481.1 hypothetical protein [Pseudomonas monteilii]MBH3455885.1 hypothetical protein [Pseudomonas monteilii]NBB04448.1 hypothetical protein [Pseudomonas monteilii]
MAYQRCRGKEVAQAGECALGFDLDVAAILAKTPDNWGVGGGTVTVVRARERG